MTIDETRYWISQEVAETKDRHTSRALFLRASYLMGKRSETLITDGLKFYYTAGREIYSITNHIKRINKIAPTF